MKLAEETYGEFSLKGLGVNQEALLKHLKPLYDDLPIDENDEEILGYTPRRRQVARILMNRDGDDWSVVRVPIQPYTQPDHEDFERSIPRYFESAPEKTTDHKEFRKLLINLANIIQGVRKGVRCLSINLFFNRSVDQEGAPGVCALEEGMHQDGVDFLVPAIVVDRQNLEATSGKSSVHTLEGEELHSSVLMPGQGHLLMDAKVLHAISHVKRTVKFVSGTRDILGLDFKVVDEDFENKRAV